jgi:DNA topoisomerase I
MNKTLVIVESPAKAKTIQKFLGASYTVLSSFGHVRDLPKKGMSIDKDNDFAPTYEVATEKKKVISELKRELKVAEGRVILATDEDREGEAISWHLCEALKIDSAKADRIVFHEITKSAIDEAIKHPRKLDLDLVNAQQARRVLDRLVGYELSPVLWKKVQRGLSAGRVQSVAVKLIVQRERELKAFEATSDYKVTAVFTAPNGEEFKAELKGRMTEEEAKEFLAKQLNFAHKVVSIEQKPGKKSPGMPFTTSTLQQEASRRLGISVKQTMRLAQGLYEQGRITYMRTDSPTLSGQAIAAAKDYITSEFGANYSHVRQFKAKGSSAQEAHEAIRPTDFRVVEAGQDDQAAKLYRLIWSRALSSQMAEAIVDKTEVTINSNGSEVFSAKGEMLKFPGYLKVYGGGKDDVILPELKQNDTVKQVSYEARQTYSKGPARFGEAALVKALEELGIGRPSTYAPTISVIQDRGYIEKVDLEGTERATKVYTLTPAPSASVTQTSETSTTGADKAKLLPTFLAEMTTDFLQKHFAMIVDYSFTANAEAEFDKVAEGKLVWTKAIHNFYDQFKPLLAGSDDIQRSETSQSRPLGTDPKSGRPVIARYGKFGPMLQIGAVEDEEKPVFANMPEGESITTVTLESALSMFTLPKLLGKTAEGEDIKANIGRFGPYVQFGKSYVSIKPHDPRDITLEQALEFISAKKEADANKYIKQFEAEGISVVNGRYGAYITDGKTNAKIPKELKAEDLTLEQCQEAIKSAPAKKGFKRRKTVKR